MTQYFGAHTLQGEWHDLLPRYVALGDRVEGKQVLDIGCGTGIGSSLLLEMGAAGVNGIDHRPEVLELARIKHAKQGLNFQVMFWEELEFPADAFDVVLCLDPGSPVTDRNLLLEIQRVLRPGGEYVCAIERKPVEGIESLLPRYGYDTAGEEVEVGGPARRVPQIGELEELFGSIESIVQRPRISYAFERGEVGSSSGGDRSPTGGDGDDAPNNRDMPTDPRLGDRREESAAVELLFCGDEQMPPPGPREVEMPYRQLVDRLQDLFSDLQGPRGLDEETTNVQKPEPPDNFEDRQETSEFEAPSPDERFSTNTGSGAESRRDPAVAPAREPTGDPRGGVPPSDRWQQVHQQLEQMTRMYHQIREEMESLFMRTRRELAERDEYIEQLVETVHRWRHDQDEEAPDDLASDTPASGLSGDSTGLDESSVPTETPTPNDSPDDGEREFERRSTNIFDRPADIGASESEAERVSGTSDDETDEESETDEADASPSESGPSTDEDESERREESRESETGDDPESTEDSDREATDDSDADSPEDESEEDESDENEIEEDGTEEENETEKTTEDDESEPEKAASTD